MDSAGAQLRFRKTISNVSLPLWVLGVGWKLKGRKKGRKAKSDQYSSGFFPVLFAPTFEPAYCCCCCWLNLYFFSCQPLLLQNINTLARNDWNFPLACACLIVVPRPFLLSAAPVLLQTAPSLPPLLPFWGLLLFFSLFFFSSFLNFYLRLPLFPFCSLKGPSPENRREGKGRKGKIATVWLAWLSFLRKHGAAKLMAIARR